MNIKKLKSLIADLPDDMEVFKSDSENSSDPYWSEYVSHVIDTPEVKRVGESSHGDYMVARRPCKETKGAKKCLVL